MISAEDFVGALKCRGFTFFTGVPCSFFQAAINRVMDDAELRYTIVPNEGAALSVASGAYLGGSRPVVLIQNSGFGNLINPLTSLNMIYRFPVLLFLSGRGYGVPDEPQHEVMGKQMSAILDALKIPYEEMGFEMQLYCDSLDRACQWMDRNKFPYAFIVRKGTLTPYVGHRATSNHFPLKRIEAIKLIASVLKGSDFIVSTTGKPSRELFSVFDRRENFYMQGSMGHAAAFGLGLALSQPNKKMVILDGDGALLMHLGILSSIGHYHPENLYHIVLDNESYETTGNQDTTSSSTDLEAMARASGYQMAKSVASGEELKAVLQRMLNHKGPAFLRVKINRLPTPDIPRITSKYTSQQIADQFRASLVDNTS